MNFDHLVSVIEQTSIGLRQRALTSVNQALVIRNWLIGYYIVEYEQKGEDRAKYGTKLLESIAAELKKKNIKGMSFTNLNLFRQFYVNYPQICQPLADQLPGEILQTLSEESDIQIIQPLAEELGLEKNQPLADKFELEKSQTLSDEFKLSIRQQRVA